MRIIKSIPHLTKTLQTFWQNKTSIGFVPTMGALHQGHASLIRAAVKERQVVVVSIFVNPLQFGPQEDLRKYPRTISKDIAMCQRLGVDVVFVPSANEMFGKGYVPLRAKKMIKTLCAPHRPGHFDGVLTVVNHLFHLVKPTHAYFGLKDYQQWRIIQRMALERYSSSIVIIGCPTVREYHGLALSSRNQYLKKSDRILASRLYATLLKGKRIFLRGSQSPAQILNDLKALLEKSGKIRVQYIQFVHSITLSETKKPKKQANNILLAAAIYLGRTRLIDNIRIM